MSASRYTRMRTPRGDDLLVPTAEVALYLAAGHAIATGPPPRRRIAIAAPGAYRTLPHYAGALRLAPSSRFRAD